MADNERISRWLVAASVMPWLAAVVPYIEAIAARAALSRWPRPMLDDPKGLPTGWLHCVFILLLLSAWVVVIVLLVLLPVSVAKHWREFRTDWRYSAYAATFCIGVATLWVVIHQDPGRVWNWFLD